MTAPPTTPVLSYLDPHDLREALRFVAAASVLQGARQKGVRHLCSSLSDLIASDTWGFAHSSIGALEVFPRPIKFVHSYRQPFNTFYRYLKAVLNHKKAAPYNLILKEKCFAGHPFTCTMAEHIASLSPGTERTEMAGFLRSISASDIMYSIVPMERKGDRMFIYGATFARSESHRPFAQRECALAHFVVTGVGWLHPGSVRATAKSPVLQLEPRFQAVAFLLGTPLEFDEIAEQTGLSVTTIRNDYAPRIYRALGVRSRSGLTALLAIGECADTSRPRR